ncbi:hypothetical protein RP20_CCG017947 [Aedes albopictus]|nr:hypothetical protein RP20_CCG017947 [Aedes albopictus]
MSVEDLPRLVDLSIGVPDGIINCNQLYKLLHLLAGGVRDIQEALGASDETVDDGDQALGGPEAIEQINDTFRRHSTALENLDSQMQELADRLTKCCEDRQTAEGLNELLAANEEQTKTAIAGLEEQMKANQDAMDERLKLLEEMLANLQRTVEDVKTKTDGVDLERLQEMETGSVAQNELLQDMDALKAQIAELLRERDEMNSIIKSLVDEKDEMNAMMSKLCAEKDQLNAMVDKLAAKAAPPGKGKPKKIARKLPKSEALTRIRARRAAGGSFTTTKPEERILRPVPMGKDPCAWWCHFDDDNYVNVPRLVRLLDEYSPTQDWYLGKPSISSPLEIFLDNAVAAVTATALTITDLVRGPVRPPR